MLRAGDVIENPVTGETITFIRTSEDTGGAQLEIELLLRPDAFLPAAHVHPAQEEEFTVLEGAVRFTSGAHADVVRAGGALLVPGRPVPQLASGRRRRRSGARRVLPAWQHSALRRHLRRPSS